MWDRVWGRPGTCTKVALFIFALSGSVAGLFGQTTMRSRVTDGHKGLPYVTVVLLNPDSTLVKGVMTDTTGNFAFENIANGAYRLRATIVGYKTNAGLTVSLSGGTLILSDIIMAEASAELGEVEVTAQKQMFEQQMDRLVVNVQSSITATGNTVLEVLQKSPGIVVNKQNNSISINGKTGVRIMINGKMMQLPPEVVMQMLDGMNASNVEKIELITTPPSKYDAEGNAGIIHIVTKENKDFGTNGTVGLTAGAHWAETLGGNFSLSRREKNFAVFLDYSVLRNHNLHHSEIDRKFLVEGFDQAVYDRSHRENVTTQQNLNAGVEWKLNDRTTVNFLLSGYRSRWSLNAVTRENSFVTPDSAINTIMNIHEKNTWQSATGGAGLVSKISSKSELGVNIDYLYYQNSNPSTYDDQSFYTRSQAGEASKIKLEKATPIGFLVAKADYQYAFSATFLLEAGVKGVTSHLNNDVLVQRQVNDAWQTDPLFTSHATLNEQIGALYVSSKWQPGKRWQINGGVRYEYTHTVISTVAQNQINRKYGYFFPSLFLTKHLGDTRELQFSYARRITRPTYNDIAPYVFFWGPTTFSAGNTSLYPAISDAVKGGYRVKQWVVSLQYTHSKREIISYQPERDGLSNNLIYRSQNLNYVNTLGMTNSYSFGVTAWWEVQSSLTMQYQRTQTSDLPVNTPLHLFQVNLNVINAVKLPHDFAVEVSGFYQTRQLAGVTTYLPQGSLNAGVQKKIGEGSVLKLAMDDILNTNYWRIRSNQPQNGLNTYFNYNFHNRYIRIVFTRRLGNLSLGAVKVKSRSEEERRRIVN